MKGNSLAGAIALALAATSAPAAPLFFQGFDISAQMPPQPGCNTGDFPGGAGTYPFPAGWLLRNVDNRTPNAAVAYVNDAWEVREDFGDNVANCVAFSTSWYNPAGQADDWMWTPAIALPSGTSTLTWRARAYDPAYPDGYEVRVMASPNTPTGGTGVIGNQLTNSTQVFSVAAEQTTWASHSVSLGAFSGQTIYVGFRNNSNDKFVLVVDDVAVIDSTPDLVAQAPAPNFSSVYSRAPDGSTVDASLGFTASNAGGSALTNVVGSATFQFNAAPLGAPLTAPSIASLAMGASSPVAFGTGHTFRGNGVWSVQYGATATETPSESNTANNSFLSPGPTIGGNEFARAEGPVSGVLGIGAGNGGEIGASFTPHDNMTVVGIRFGMSIASTVDDGMGGQIPNPFIGSPLVANLRAYDNTTPPGKPGAAIDTTVPVMASDTVGVYDVMFVGGGHLLTGGTTYVVTVSEPTGGNSMPLNMHANRFTPGTTWVNWPTSPSGDWANLESFGASFAKTPAVSMLVESSIFKDGFEVAAAASRPGGQAPAAPAILQAAPSRKRMPTQLVTGR